MRNGRYASTGWTPGQLALVGGGLFLLMLGLVVVAQANGRMDQIQVEGGAAVRYGQLGGWMERLLPEVVTSSRSTTLRGTDAFTALAYAQTKRLLQLGVAASGVGLSALLLLVGDRRLRVRRRERGVGGFVTGAGVLLLASLAYGVLAFFEGL